LVEALKGGFNLILSDIIMPKKDGVTFLKEYGEKTPDNPNGPIVMLTVLGQDPIIKSCLQMGASGFLIKSELTPDQVLKEVRGYITNYIS
jgi:DNA-binding NarL/FixJ family response regulator